MTQLALIISDPPDPDAPLAGDIVAVHGSASLRRIDDDYYIVICPRGDDRPWPWLTTEFPGDDWECSFESFEYLEVTHIFRP